MRKRVKLRLTGSFDQGFLVYLQIRDENAPPDAEDVIEGRLPPALNLAESLKKWQEDFENRVKNSPNSKSSNRSRATARRKITSFSDSSAKELENDLNRWLDSDLKEWRIIRDSLQQSLDPSDEIQIILQTQNIQLRQLPWQAWELFNTQYPKAEIALSATTYQASKKTPAVSKKIRILAVLGNSDNINIEFDQRVLKQLEAQGAEVKFLSQPEKRDLLEHLWDKQGWHIFFFAGHSSTSEDGESGWFEINQNETLEISELKNALSRAIEHGLQLAIFNSCDGLGLASQLAKLHLAQSIVMRELVPDQVAQEFLQHFLAAFAGGKSSYASVREARNKLEDRWNKKYPGVSWLPVICQNPALVPLSWQELCSRKTLNSRCSLWAVILGTGIIATSLLGLRYLGAFEKLELQAFDQMLQMRSQEEQDSRLLVVEVTEKDIQTQRETTLGAKSISDKTLAKLLNKLQQYQPRVIGVDIYRDIADPTDKSKLSNELNQDNIVAVCKGKDSKYDPQGIKPPEGVPQDRQGFTDALRDPDGIVRRQILMMRPEPSSPCTTEHSLSLQLAARYLFNEGIEHKFSEDNDYVQFGSTVFKRLTLGRSGGYQRGVNLGGTQILVNYRASDYQKVSLGDVLNGAITPSLVKDKVVLIGITANSTSDTWSTPYSAIQQSYQETPGVLIQAQMVSQIISAVLDKRLILWVLPYWGDILWICGWSLIGGLIVWRIHSLLGYLCAIVATIIVLYGVCAVILFIKGAWVPFIPSAFAIVVSGAVVLVFKQSSSDSVY